MERKKRVVSREVCVKRSERSNHRTRKRGGAEHAEVSRGHSRDMDMETWTCVKDERVVQLIKRYLKRGVPCVRYADAIVLLAKSKRTSERLLESSTKYLEEKLKLTVNREKSRTVSGFAIRNFKFLGFALGRNGSGIYVRVHPKSWKKPKTKVRNLIKMGVPEDLVYMAGNSWRGHWFTTHTVAINMAMTKERLINSGFYDLATAYQSVHVNY